MKLRPLLTIPALLAAGACASTEGAAPAPSEPPPPPRSTWSEGIERWGTLREALHDGHDEGRVPVSNLARRGVYAVGVLEGLRGEVSVVDGEVWISLGSAESTETVREAGTAQATVLFAAEVAKWHRLPVERDVSPSKLDAYVAGQARTMGIDTSEPFPFVVAGELTGLKLHVLAGECPIRARKLGETMQEPAFEMHADKTLGRLVGIYAEGASGVVCQPGTTTHVHAVFADGEGLTGHVETVGLKAGAQLFLPER